MQLDGDDEVCGILERVSIRTAIAALARTVVEINNGLLSIFMFIWCSIQFCLHLSICIAIVYMHIYLTCLMPLHYLGEQLCSAAAAGRASVLEAYHLAQADLGQPDGTGRTALHVVRYTSKTPYVATDERGFVRSVHLLVCVHFAVKYYTVD